MQNKISSQKKDRKSKSRRRYRRYTLDMRLKLIDLVLNQNMSTTKAGALLKIKQTSANRIMKSYLLKNKIFEKKSDRIERQANQAVKQTQKCKEQRIPYGQIIMREGPQLGNQAQGALNFNERSSNSVGQAQNEGSFYPTMPLSSPFIPSLDFYNPYNYVNPNVMMYLGGQAYNLANPQIYFLPNFQYQESKWH